MAFPTTGILDNFDRTDNPLTLGSNWVTSGDLSGISSFTAYVPAIVNGYSASQWNTAYSNNNVEAYLILSAGSGNDNYVAIFTDTSSSNGYAIETRTSTTITINRETGGSDTVLATFTQSRNDGDGIGISIIGTVLTAFYKASGGSWVPLGTYDISGDATKYSTCQYPGMILLDTTVRINDFGGGTISKGIMNLKTGWWGDL